MMQAESVVNCLLHTHSHIHAHTHTPRYLFVAIIPTHMYTHTPRYLLVAINCCCSYTHTHTQITILLAALVSIQLLMIAGCCVCWMKHRSDQDQLQKLITDLEKEIKVLNKSHVYDKLNGRKTNNHIPRVDGTSLNCTDQTNDKESLEGLMDLPTTICSSSSLFSSSSQELSSSSYSSLPALNVLPSQLEVYYCIWIPGFSVFLCF